MTFTALDWIAILAYFAITLLLGLYFRRRAGKSTEDYFVSGRKVSWWLAGTSMVATTFAADTPLVVAGIVYTQGIAGNWIWWAFLLSGMMTVFFFARLVAAVRADDRRAVCRNPLCRKAGGLLARISRGLSRLADELRDSRMGDASDDEHRLDDPRADDGALDLARGLRKRSERRIFGASFAGRTARRW